MKKPLAIATTLAALFLISCKNETKVQHPEVEDPTELQIGETPKEMPEIACYRYVSAQDTIVLQMEKMENDVAGTLSYNYFEKDKNDGTFEGQMAGDTLFATYTYGAEGRTSVREVMFLKMKDRLIEGFGEVEQVDGRMRFKKNTKFTFNTLMPLQQMDCDAM